MSVRKSKTAKPPESVERDHIQYKCDRTPSPSGNFSVRKTRTPFFVFRHPLASWRLAVPPRAAGDRRSHPLNCPGRPSRQRAELRIGRCRKWQFSFPEFAVSVLQKSQVTRSRSSRPVPTTSKPVALEPGRAPAGTMVEGAMRGEFAPTLSSARAAQSPSSRFRRRVGTGWVQISRHVDRLWRSLH